jgi:hypothetical protein
MSAILRVGDEAMTDKEHEIRARAYRIWEEEGQPHGRADDHWHRAASELAALMPAQPELMLNPAATATVKPAKKAAVKKAAAPRKATTAPRKSTAKKA